MKVLGVIPSRYGAVRFPGKPLIDLNGKTMIQRVWEQAKGSKSLSEVVVATDDQRIMEVVRGFGGQGVLTDPKLASGTDRVAQAAAGFSCELVVNIQGDEPLLPSAMIDEVVRPFTTDPGLVMGSLRTKLIKKDDYALPQVVKVVVDKNDFALYFSRSLVPYPRAGEPLVYKHVGLYAYRSEFLKSFAKLSPSPLEKAEGLEQLRVLENGFRIKVPETQWDSFGVDTPEDAEKVRSILKQTKQS